MRGLSAQGTIALILLVVSCTADGATDLVAPSSTTAAESESPAPSREGLGATETVTSTVELEDGGSVDVVCLVGCRAATGGATDLEAEPALWLAHGTYHRWSEATGCPIRIDVISHIHGAEHCDWEETEFITIGDPLGASIGRERLSESARRFVWNEGGAIPTLAPARSILRSELPDGAYDTGFRNGEAELWLHEASDSVLYRVEGDEAQVWVLDPTAGLCM